MSGRPSPLPLALVLALAGGCASVRVTPAGIRAAPVEAAEREAVLGRWERAIELANDFLASNFRRTLPEGHYTLDEARGMTFHATDTAWPIAVRCTTWGDVCTTSGFAAQERSWGFVVGQRAPRRDRKSCRHGLPGS